MRKKQKVKNYIEVQKELRIKVQKIIEGCVDVSDQTFITDLLVKIFNDMVEDIYKSELKIADDRWKRAERELKLLKRERNG
jgi:hypothetical protein